MCGLIGYLGNAKPADLSLLMEARETMKHRGPDGSGFWQRPIELGPPYVAFGHRRLAILDLSDAALQPMILHDEKGSPVFVIVFNGEIYNYLEIRDLLVAAGHHFQTQSDTEVLLHAYVEWGENCLERLNGMFAFLIWDEKKKKLFAARDRFGERPLYFAKRNNTWIFGSEVRSIWSFTGMPRRFFGPVFFNWMLPARTQYGRHTIFQDIDQLLPHEQLTIEADGKGIFSKYWNLPEPNNRPRGPISNEEVDEFRERLTSSLRLRLRSDVPVGTSLSGGLDSTSVAALLVKKLGAKNLQTFSAQFPGWELDETRSMKQVIENLGVVNYVVEPSDAGALADLDEFVRAQEMPCGAASYYAQFCVMRLAQQYGVTVLLDGQGADELLGGYPWHYSSRILALAKGLRFQQAMRMQQEGRELIGKGPLRWQQAVYSLNRLVFSPVLWRKEAQALGVNHSSAVENVYAPLRWTLVEANLDSVQTRDLFDSSLPGLLQIGDRNAMWFSREPRLPYLDHTLVEWLWQLGPEVRLQPGATKAILREAMAGLLPEPVRTSRRKIGFAPPQTSWLAGILRPAAENALEQVSSTLRSWVCVSGLRKLKESIDKPQCLQETSPAIWRWLMVARTQQVFNMENQ